MAQFRSSFKFFDKEILHWFPGHMGKGMRKMQQMLKTVDCIVEVHDARIPLSGLNQHFRKTLIGVKPHILVLNKRDLSDRKLEQHVRDRVLKEGFQHVLHTNCKDIHCKGLKKIVPLAKDVINSSNRYNRSEETDLNMMVIGVPNVGKSSLINMLRSKNLNKKSALQVGAKAGVTRSVHTRTKICEDPPMYLLDTPGVMTPRVENVDTALRLALCASFPDHLLGPTLIADYLLYVLNKRRNFSYVDLFKLDEPIDCINTVLIKGAVHLGKTNKVHDVNGQYVIKPNMEYAATHFIKAFRNGELGRFLLDKDLLQ